MKTIKSVLFTGVALAGILSLQSMARATETSAATQPAKVEQDGAVLKHMQKVATELGLTAEQKQQLKPILRGERAKLKALRDDQSLTRLEKRKKLMALREELMPQLKGVLTPEQLAKWQQLRQQRLAKAGPSTPQP